MSLPLIKSEDFIGKTIKEVNFTACNWIKFIFTDETIVELEIEYLGHNLHGIVQQGIV